MKAKKLPGWAGFLKQMVIVEGECVEENCRKGRGACEMDEESNAKTRRDFASLEAKLPILLAAPELLSALKLLLEESIAFMDDGGEWDGYRTKGMKAAKKAIAKAERGAR